MIYTEEESERIEAARILKIAKERAEERYKNVISAEDTRRLISELELMLSEKVFRPDSKIIHIEMMKLTDRFLTLTV